VRLNWTLPLSADGVTGELDNGRAFLIRPMRSTDGPALEAAFAQMSPRSRYLRFFTVRDKLGSQLANALTNIDHDDHRAWVVADPESPSDAGTDEGRGIAVARLVVVSHDPKTAEAAVAVIDDEQGQGFGHLLLDLLVTTATDTGVEFLRFETLAENTPMRALLRELGAKVNRELTDREVLVFDLPLGDRSTDADPAIGALYDLLRWIASSAEGDTPDGPPAEQSR
jgi:acetyltransferase